MLMSKSRLEKFLYALYSLDSSDLPTPLSRIEELYSCWVTGAEPSTFEPISRVEKYLMAILGVYDVESLPNPLSRVEVLLYKLATGDDNLDDFEIFLSEHEELLAEIIRNGGAGGNINIEYVLYTLSTEFNTLYNTAKKPVKSAILKGNTKYRDIDTGDILDTFDETKNLELVSVKMPVLTTTGENLICVGRGYDNSVTINGVTITRDVVNQTITFDGTCTADNTNVPLATFNHQMKTGESYILSAHLISGTSGEVYFRVNTSNWSSNISCKYTSGSLTQINYTFGKDYLFNSSSIRIDSGETFNNAVFKVMFEKIVDNSTTTPYEPYKSNILTVNEDVELRGIGNVKDELNLLTGELTQRIGEIVLDGSDENWVKRNNGDGTNTISFNIPLDTNKYDEIILDKFTLSQSSADGIEGFGYATDIKALFIEIKRDRLNNVTLSGFKQWLSQNPITVQYKLATESVKTVYLSVVDQDGNNTKLKTFNDITYVTLSSEGLIPEVELEVATKNEEVLSTMNLEMNDISTTQNALQETSDIQSENVDATMIATTEIYEELL